MKKFSVQIIDNTDKKIWIQDLDMVALQFTCCADSSFEHTSFWHEYYFTHSIIPSRRHNIQN